MKNITMTINPNAVTSLAPLPAQGLPMKYEKVTSVSLSAQFDDEMKAVEFTKFMLENIQNYKAGGV